MIKKIKLYMPPAANYPVQLAPKAWKDLCDQIKEQNKEIDEMVPMYGRIAEGHWSYYHGKNDTLQCMSTKPVPIEEPKPDYVLEFDKAIEKLQHIVDKLKARK